MINRRKAGMRSSHHGPYRGGLQTCYNGGYNGLLSRKAELILKTSRSPDRSLQLDSLKSESLVIANQHVAVNTFPGFVHTARQVMGVGCTRSG